MGYAVTSTGIELTTKSVLADTLVQKALPMDFDYSVAGLPWTGPFNLGNVYELDVTNYWLLVVYADICNLQAASEKYGVKIDGEWTLNYHGHAISAYQEGPLAESPSYHEYSIVDLDGIHDFAWQFYGFFGQTYQVKNPSFWFVRL